MLTLTVPCRINIKRRRKTKSLHKLLRGYVLLLVGPTIARATSTRRRNIVDPALNALLIYYLW